mgnify:CR=1 FL=1
MTYCPKLTQNTKILLGATFRVVLTPLSRHGTIIKIICERVNCAMVSIREGLSCCDKTHGAVFLPHAVSGASFLTFPLLGKSYFFACAAIAAQSREARCNSRSAERGCSSVHPPPNRRRMGGGSNLALLLGGSSKPRTTANKLSPRRAKLALNVRIGCSCRAHNHHKFSHRILQPHTKRRASHAD